MNYYLLISFLFLTAFTGYAQDIPDTTATTSDSTRAFHNFLSDLGVFPKAEPKPLRKLAVTGYYRFFATHRLFDRSYPDTTTAKREIFLTDDAQLPMLLMNFVGKPNKKTTFGTDLYMYTPYRGQGQIENLLSLQLGINLYGTYTTDHGNFNVRAGGIHWHNQSPFTLGTFQGYNRYTVFERNPWDPVEPSIDSRYKRFYESGTLVQDIRWGKQAIQGIIIDGSQLPEGFSFSAMYGKTQISAGPGPLPDVVYGGRLSKEFGTRSLHLNTLNGITWEDSLNTSRIGYNIHTLEYNWKLKEINLIGELGMGRYQSRLNRRGWGEAVSMKFQFPKKYTVIPFELHAFQISPNVVNNNGEFWNTSIAEAQQADVEDISTGNQDLLRPFSSAMVQVGQMTNNRRGLNLNADYTIKKLKLGLGIGTAAEIEATRSVITYGHRVNSLTFSRFFRWAFPANVGPYGRVSKVFRGVYETVQLTDSTTLSRKYFNALEPTAKYTVKVFGRDLYLFYLGTFLTVQKSFSAIPVFSDQAYVRAFYNQFELYYQINRKVMLTGYFGLERIRGNMDTQLDAESLLPLDQTGRGIGAGFDFAIGEKAWFYMRHRWFSFEDANFVLSKFSGQETVVELKYFF